jgi:hypothetical protein
MRKLVVLLLLSSCSLENEDKRHSYTRREIIRDTLECGGHALIFPRIATVSAVQSSSEVEYSRLIYKRGDAIDSLSAYSLTYGRCPYENQEDCLSGLDCQVVYSSLYPFDSISVNEKSILEEDIILLRCNEHYFLWIFLDGSRYFKVESKGSRDVVDFYMTMSEELQEI